MDSSTVKSNSIFIILCFLILSVQNTVAKSNYPNPLYAVGCLPGALGAALIYYSAPFLYKSEDTILTECVEELQGNVEKRRHVVHSTLEKLQNKLNVLQSEGKEHSSIQSLEEKKIIRQLEQSCEELSAIELDYQVEYVLVRQRVRGVKATSVFATTIGGLWILINAAVMWNITHGFKKIL